ncbi:hypothetical protein LPTSP4_17920 [Leptospira ryugenii]|uniref:Uncharacterized protein n=1 Tax=Leptospira ryugenii TaxID=1917863 RepID=A0A2P2E051_9LEPT|nr:hypothetical protein [Leptospira ryugenii]GBF50267.1 hypothetical protein LPTSP4_17920 [Leptospira ryugenii]
MNPEKGKQGYIKVDDISEIDPNKLSISQAHQRYVDRDNNRYALRFNKDTRRLEIIKLTTSQGVEVVQSTPNPVPQSKPIPNMEAPAPIIEKPPILLDSEPPIVERRQSPRDEALLGGDTDLDIVGIEESRHSNQGKAEELANSSAISFEKSDGRTSAQMIDYVIKVLSTYKEKANAIIRNIQSSRIFELTGDPSENKNIVGNLAREFESQIFEGIDKMIDLHKEMTSYPRPITYYISKAPTNMREDMKAIDSDKEKLEKLHLYEMQKHSHTIVKAMKSLSLQLLNILNLKTDSQVKQLQYQNQLMFVDAKNASLYFTQDLDKTIIEIEDWKNSK